MNYREICLYTNLGCPESRAGMGIVMEFRLHSEYQPTGDQPQAIDRLVAGFMEGNQFQTLVGVTGSGNGEYNTEASEADAYYLS